MQIVRQQADISINGAQRSVDFKFNTTPEVMQMFFKDIYRDPILAVIRELSCNAVDAHKMNGNEGQPFDVHLPTDLEPWFEIRDYGTGLSQDKVETLYSTFFESTKQATNDFIGGLGIGSKSPLAYTDMFTVTSYFDGTQYQYIVSKNKLGVPTMNFIAEMPTTEANGLAINVAIKGDGYGKSRDIQSFNETAKKVYLHFDPKPNLTGAATKLPFPEYSIKHGTWAMRKQDNNGLIAVMGKIQYPINIENMRIDEVTKQKLNGIIFTQTTGWTRRYAPSDIDLSFNIGTLSITPSREELQYDERTINTIMAKFEAVRQEFVTHTQKQVDAQPNFIKACEMFSDLPSGVQQAVRDFGIKWNNRSLLEYVDLIIPEKVTTTEVHFTDAVGNTQTRKETVKVPHFEIFYIPEGKMQNGVANNKRLSILGANRMWRYNFNLHQKPILFVKDERTANVNPKVIPYLRANEFKGADWVNSQDEYMFLNPLTIEMKDKAKLEAEINQFLTKHGLEAVKVVYLSDLTADSNLSIKMVKKPAGSAPTYLFETIDVTQSLDLANKPANVSELDWCQSLEKKGFAIVTDNITPKTMKGTVFVYKTGANDPKIHALNLYNPFVRLILSKLGHNKIYVVPSARRQKHITEHWVELETLVTEQQIVDEVNKLLPNPNKLSHGLKLFKNETQVDIEGWFNLLKEQYPSVYTKTTITDFRNWHNSVVNEVKKYREGSEARLMNAVMNYSISSKLNKNEVKNVDEFFEITKKFGDIKDFFENKISCLAWLSPPNKPYQMTAKEQTLYAKRKIQFNTLLEAIFA